MLSGIRVPKGGSEKYWRNSDRKLSKIDVNKIHQGCKKLNEHQERQTQIKSHIVTL